MTADGIRGELGVSPYPKWRGDYGFNVHMRREPREDEEPIVLRLAWVMPQAILCRDSNTFSETYYTNDPSHVTCKRCLELLKNDGRGQPV